MSPRPKRTSERVPPGTYERLVAEHGEFCAICGRPPKTRRLHIDHDHRTEEIRGLLCHACNRRLWTGATPEWLLDAYIYLMERGDVYRRPQTVAQTLLRLHRLDKRAVAS